MCFEILGSVLEAEICPKLPVLGCIKIFGSEVLKDGFMSECCGSECKNYRSISLLSLGGKMYVGILVDWVCRVTGGLIDDDQGGFRAGRGYVEQIFTLKQMGVKAWEKSVVYMGSIGLVGKLFGRF